MHLHFCLFYLRGSRKLIVSNRSMFSPKLKFECILGSIHVCKTHCDFNMKPMYVFVLFWSADAFCAFPYRLQVSLSFLGVGCLSCFFISCSFVLCTAGPLWIFPVWVGFPAICVSTVLWRFEILNLILNYLPTCAKRWFEIHLLWYSIDLVSRLSHIYSKLHASF